jgi:hypothetical protein
MKRFTIAFALLALSLLALPALAENRVEVFYRPAGTDYFALAQSHALATWASNRIAVTDNGDGSYTVTLDDSVSKIYGIYVDDVQPASRNEAELTSDLNTPTTAAIAAAVAAATPPEAFFTNAPEGGGGGGPTAAEFVEELLATTTTDTGANTFGRAIHYLRLAWASAGVYNAPALAAAPTSEPSDAQPRVNFEPDEAFIFRPSDRSDGVYVCDRPLWLAPGSVEVIYPAFDMSGLFGKTFVRTVGTPTISGGSVAPSAEGPRDSFAMTKVEGTATAGERRTMIVPVTMVSGAVVKVKLEVNVFDE